MEDRSQRPNPNHRQPQVNRLSNPSYGPVWTGTMARASRLNAVGNVGGADAPQEPVQPGRRGCFGRAARVGIACLLHLVVVASASAVEGLPGWGANLDVS